MCIFVAREVLCACAQKSVAKERKKERKKERMTQRKERRERVADVAPTAFMVSRFG